MMVKERTRPTKEELIDIIRMTLCDGTFGDSFGHIPEYPEPGYEWGEGVWSSQKIIEYLADQILDALAGREES